MMTMVISGSDGVTFPDSTNQFSGGAFSFKNRIINGDMRIDQRNAGAAIATGQGFAVDRWQADSTQASKLNIQQNNGSVTPPAGFTNYWGANVATAYTITATDTFYFRQMIEGLNVSDLGWGTANAKTVTLSFWVRSSLTGTFGGAIKNSANNRSYPFTYSISASNTWEQKSVTIAGDTSGTWLTTNGTGIRVVFNQGVGSNLLGTAGAWAGANYDGATGQVQLVETLNATWYVTGVQLEVGSVATPFERRPYGTELALCQRYYWRMINGGSQAIGTGGYYNSTDIRVVVNFPVAMRIAPSVVSSSGADYFRIQRNNDDDNFNSFSDAAIKTPTTILIFTNANVSGTAGQVGFVFSIDPSASLAFNSEL
jgi:hypothetical protein